DKCALRKSEVAVAGLGGARDSQIVVLLPPRTPLTPPLCASLSLSLRLSLSLSLVSLSGNSLPDSARQAADAARAVAPLLRPPLPDSIPHPTSAGEHPHAEPSSRALWRLKPRISFTEKTRERQCLAALLEYGKPYKTRNLIPSVGFNVFKCIPLLIRIFNFLAFSCFCSKYGSSPLILLMVSAEHNATSVKHKSRFVLSQTGPACQKRSGRGGSC
ncbi:hypothetical protein ANANG_G00199590, partial [Anguilla anguilla]